MIKTNPRKDAAASKAIVELKSAFVKHFKELKKTSAGNMVAWNALQVQIELILHRVYLDAYYQGCKDVDLQPDTMEVLRFRRMAQSRAKQVCEWMRDSTLKELGIHAAKSLKEKKAKVYGVERAEDAASHEIFTAYYVSRVKGWHQDKASKKESVLSGDHDNDDICDDCADQGPIPIEEEFESGEQAPPHHFGCECVLWLHKGD
jgi:hypothetical protein